MDSPKAAGNGDPENVEKLAPSSGQQSEQTAAIGDDAMQEKDKPPGYEDSQALLPCRQPDAGLPCISKLADASGTEASQIASASEALQTKRLHVSCRDFAKMSKEKVAGWLSEISPVSLAEVVKQKSWGYAFVTLTTSEASHFLDSVHGVRFKAHTISVKDAHSRDESKRPRENDNEAVPGAKRHKTSDDSAERVPTLMELKLKAKQHKDKIESVLAKSSPLQKWPYETQLMMKNTYAKTSLRSLLKQVSNTCDEEGLTSPAWTNMDWLMASSAERGCACPLVPALGCPKEGLDGYRNKCEFTISRNEAGETDVGFVLRVTADGAVIVGDCNEVPAVPQQMKKLCRILRDCIPSSNFGICGRQQGAHGSEGTWRLVTVRMTVCGEMLVLMQTKTLDNERKQQMAELLIKTLVPTDLRVVSIYLQFNDDVTDAAKPAAPLMHIHGKHTIEMPLLGSTFALGPLNFWNPNTATNNTLYERALDWLNIDKDTIVLDVCCGMGTYAILCCVRGCKEAIGIDFSEQDVIAARENAVANGVSNASFRVGKVEDVIPAVLGDLPLDVKVYAVIDPPRPGVHHRGLSAMKRCEALKRIVYVSCNPDSLAEDAAKLCKPDEINPFVPVRAVTVDTFPGTLQFEMIMQLDRADEVIDPRSTTASVEAGTE